ncbi:DUF4286 family protein [Flavisolibacter sp. BT320]|nr:DUF4286 family protein [Flavisolibacter longurius]
MIIYNVTIKVDASIAESWQVWMLEEHIPEVMQTGCFSGYKVVRLLEVDESEGPTYAIQYLAESKADYNRYIQLHVSGLRDASYQKWGDRFIAFRSVMQVIRDSSTE